MPSLKITFVARGLSFGGGGILLIFLLEPDRVTPSKDKNYFEPYMCTFTILETRVY